MVFMKSFLKLITLSVGILYGNLVMGGDISITYYQLPVLIGEKSTPIIQVQLKATEKDMGKVFSGLTFNFEGSTAMDAIKNIRVYHTGSDTSIKPALNQQQLLLEYAVGGVKNTIPFAYT